MHFGWNLRWLRAEAQENVVHRASSFELFGYDFMVDEDMVSRKANVYGNRLLDVFGTPRFRAGGSWRVQGSLGSGSRMVSRCI